MGLKSKNELLHSFDIYYHMYADDTQLYLSFDFSDPSSFQDSVTKLQQCVSQVKSWMTNNKPKLNDEKTEFLYITSKYSRDHVAFPEFLVDDSSIKPQSSVRNIGVIFDKTMQMNANVFPKLSCTAQYFQI